LHEYGRSGKDVKKMVTEFFTRYNDGDLLNFIEVNGDAKSRKLKNVRILNPEKTSIKKRHGNLHIMMP